MKKSFLFFVTIFIAIRLFSQIPAGYYNGATGLTGTQLRAALRDIITAGHTTNSYNNLYTYYQSTDNKGNNVVWDMYSDVPGGSPAYIYHYEAGDECGNYTGEGICYNREHSFPSSWFNDGSPMKADLFHVYPTDGYVNNKRSNLPFGEVANPSWTSTNGCKTGSCSYPGYTGTVFEPIDEYKGDFARTYFYMATRYYNNFSNWSSPMISGDNYTEWAINMLLEWHVEAPVSQKEINRNNAAHDIQNNRNPFIDFPEWACDIWGENCGTALRFTSNPVIDAVQNVLYTYNISFENNDNSTISLEEVTIPDWLELVQNSNSSGTLSGYPTNNNLNANSVSIKITDATSEAFQNFTITVQPEGSIDLLNQNFTTCSISDWTIYNVSGSKDWTCNSSVGNISANAYGSTGNCNDWLISPALNLDNFSNEVLSFQSFSKYTDVNYPQLKAFVSNDYTGTGNPESYTWQQLQFTASPQNSQAWTASGNIDISSIAGSSVYIAFQYVSSGTGAGTSSEWRIDDVIISGSTVVGMENTEILNNNLVAYPNPFSDNLTVKFNLSENSNLQIDLLNVFGQKINSFNFENSPEELKIINIPTGNLSSGVYLLVLRNGTESTITKIIKN